MRVTWPGTAIYWIWLLDAIGWTLTLMSIDARAWRRSLPWGRVDATGSAPGHLFVLVWLVRLMGTPLLNATRVFLTIPPGGGNARRADA